MVSKSYGVNMTEKEIKKLVVEAKKFLKLVESILWATTKLGAKKK